MLLQRGKFLINSISEIDTIDKDKDEIKRVIALHYMVKAEFEGNAIASSRMFFEYFKDEYEFFPIGIYNKNHEQLFIYFNTQEIKKWIFTKSSSDVIKTNES